MRSAWWLVLVAGCGSKAAPKRDVVAVPEVPASARIALAAVPPAALGEVHAASYLTVAADGALAIGRIDARGEVDVSSLAATPTEDLSGWYSTREPPVPLSADALADAGVFGMIGGGGLGGAFGRIDYDGYGGLEGFGEPVMRACGNALHLDARLESPVALLIPDAAADARVVLDVMEQMPRPVALIARGDDPRGLALRLIADQSAVITATHRVHVTVGVAAADVRDHVDRISGARTQSAIVVDEGATAQDLLAVLGGLASAGVAEVVIDRGVECADYTGNGGFGFGDENAGWGVPPGESGSIGSGGAGSGYGGGGHHHAVPHVGVGEIVVTGDADEARVRAALEGERDQLQYCYTQAHLARPELGGGEVTIALAIDPDGSASPTNVTGFDTELAECLAARILAMEFPDTRRGGEATVTFLLSLD